MRNEEILEKLKKNLKGLELIIKVQTGIDCKGRLKVEIEEYKRSNTVSFRISSSSLRDLLDPLSRQIFKDINFYFWGGQLNKEGKVWFSPKVSYDHVLGGSNGCDIIWDALWFNIETETWIPSK